LVNEVSQKIKPEIKVTRATEEKPKEGKGGALVKIADKILYKAIDERSLEPIIEEYLLLLAEADVALEAAEGILYAFKEELVGSKVKKGEDVRKIVERSLRDALFRILDVPSIDLVTEAKKAIKDGRLLKIMIMGVNGVGKTTTIAKLSYTFKKAGMTPGC
jgi:signal recognition particle GTPase